MIINGVNHKGVTVRKGVQGYYIINKNHKFKNDAGRVDYDALVGDEDGFVLDVVSAAFVRKCLSAPIKYEDLPEEIQDYLKLGTWK